MDVRRVSFEALHDQLFELLRKPMSLDELVEELGPDLDASDDPHGLLRWVLADDRRLMWMSDDVYCRLDSVYDGITFSHRLTADEIERGVIADVDEWSILIDHFETVRVGDDQVPTSTTYVEADRAVLIVGLESVLADCSPGTVCGLAVDHSGLAFIPVVEEATIPDDLTSAFTEAFNAAAKSPTWPVAVADVLRSGLLLDRPRWLGTLPPLTELAVAAGYQSRRSQAASSSFEWDLFEAAGPTRVAATQFHLDTKRQQDLHITVDEYRKWRTSGRVAGTLGATPTAALLADPAVGEAFVAAQVGHGEETLADLASFASMIADGVDPDYRASCLWIRSLAAEEAGDFDTHERLLREAIAIDPGHDAAITALGWLLFDKSNLVEAFQRLDEVGDESELVDVIAQLTAPARSGAGRNDPCACGSGQKFKRCHGGQTLSAGDRIDLLYQKVARPLLEQQGIPDWWTWPGGWPTGPASWHRGLEQLDERGVLIDILLDEGGGMQEFLDRRGALLPADEVGFLRLWVEISRQVWQVVSTDLEAGTAMVELADQSSGSPIEIDRLAPSGFLDEGDLLIARLLPIENGGRRAVRWNDRRDRGRARRRLDPCRGDRPVGERDCTSLYRVRPTPRGPGREPGGLFRSLRRGDGRTRRLVGRVRQPARRAVGVRAGSCRSVPRSVAGPDLRCL